MGKYAVGIDLGGTKILSIIVSEKGKIISSSKAKTKPELGISGVCERLKEIASEALEKASLGWRDIGDIGIAVPTSVDPVTGDALHSPALGWKNQPIRKRLQDIFRRKVYLQNDANCGILAEYHLGAARGCKSVVGYFVGTGLGGGIVIDGKLHLGVRGSAGELGHEIIRYNGRECGCGKRGCIEAYCSKTAFCRQFYKAIVEDNRKSVLSEFADTEFKNIRSSVLAKAYRTRDRITRRIVDKGFYMLGLAAANQASIIAPECIVFGGGVVSALKEQVMPMIRKGFNENLFALSPRDVALKISRLGDNAVPLGAAIYAKNKGQL